MDVPNDTPPMASELKEFLAKATGFPVDAIEAAMFLITLKPGISPGDAAGSLAYGGNLPVAGMLALTFEAVETLYDAMRNQAIADAVPDDISGLDDLAA